MTHSNDDLDDALGVLFGTAEEGRVFVTLPQDEVVQAMPVSVPGRVVALQRTLEGYVIQHATELNELGEEERPRLQAEARATLVALREIRRWLGGARD